MTGVALGTLAGLIHLSSFGIYCRKIFRNKVLPNTATWVLWVYLSALNATSYIAMSRDPFKGAVAIAGAVACAIIFFLSLFKGRLSAISAYDAATIVVGIIAGLIWFFFQSASFANLVMQAGFLLSMVPSYRKVLRDGESEPPVPWFLWSLAHAIGTLVVLIRWSENFPDLAYPVLSMLSHGGIGVIAVLNKKNKTPNRNRQHHCKRRLNHAGYRGRRSTFHTAV